MNDVAANVVIALSLIMAGWCAVTVARNRLIRASHLIGVAVLEVTVLVLAGIAVATLIGGDRPGGELGPFIGYLVSTVIAPPIGASLGLAERSRWGPAVVGVVCLVLPVLVVRLQQIWDGTGV
jgi:hypothetical protein